MAEVLEGRIVLTENISAALARAQAAAQAFMNVTNALKGNLSALENTQVNVLFRADISEVDRAVAAVDKLTGIGTRAEICVGADVTQALSGTDLIKSAVATLKDASNTVLIQADATEATREVERLHAAMGFIDGTHPKLRISAETTGATSELEGLRAAVDGLAGAGAEIHVGADISEVDRAVAAMGKLAGSGAEIHVGADTSGATAGFDAVKAQADKLAGSGAEVPVGADTAPAENSLRGLISKFASAAIVVKVAATAKDLVAQGLEYAASLETANVAWTTLLGSQEAAVQQMDTLRSMAANTPFEFSALSDVARKLSMAGYEGERLSTALTSVGDAVAAMGGGANEMQGISTALYQMYTKGQIYAEEMLQLSERGIPAWEILAQKMGVAQSELKDMGRDGKLIASEVLPLLIEGMGERFGGAMQAQSQTMKGMLSTAKDLAGSFLADTTSGMFDTLKGSLKEVIAMFKTPAAAEFAADLGKTLGSVTKTVLNLGKTLFNMRGVILGVGAAFAGMKGLSLFSTIGNKLSKVWALFSKSKDAIKGVSGIGGALSAVAEQADELYGKKNKLSGFLNVLKSPTTWITAGITAAAVGIGVLISKAVEASTEIDRLNAGLNSAMQEAADNVQASLAQNSSAFAQEVSNLAQVQAQYDKLRSLIAGGQGKSAQANALVSSMVSLMPELEGSVENVNGAWRLVGDSIQDAIDKALQLAAVNLASSNVQSLQKEISDLTQSDGWKAHLEKVQQEEALLTQANKKLEAASGGRYETLAEVPLGAKTKGLQIDATSEEKGITQAYLGALTHWEKLRKLLDDPDVKTLANLQSKLADTSQQLFAAQEGIPFTAGVSGIQDYVNTLLRTGNAPGSQTDWAAALAGAGLVAKDVNWDDNVTGMQQALSLSRLGGENAESYGLNRLTEILGVGNMDFTKGTLGNIQSYLGTQGANALTGLQGASEQTLAQMKQLGGFSENQLVSIEKLTRLTDHTFAGMGDIIGEGMLKGFDSKSFTGALQGALVSAQADLDRTKEGTDAYAAAKEQADALGALKTLAGGGVLDKLFGSLGLDTNTLRDLFDLPEVSDGGNRGSATAKPTDANRTRTQRDQSAQTVDKINTTINFGAQEIGKDIQTGSKVGGASLGSGVESGATGAAARLGNAANRVFGEGGAVLGAQIGSGVSGAAQTIAGATRGATDHLTQLLQATDRSIQLRGESARGQVDNLQQLLQATDRSMQLRGESGTGEQAALAQSMRAALASAFSAAGGELQTALSAAMQAATVNAGSMLGAQMQLALVSAGALAGMQIQSGLATGVAMAGAMLSLNLMSGAMLAGMSIQSSLLTGGSMAGMLLLTNLVTGGSTAGLVIMSNILLGGTSAGSAMASAITAAGNSAAGAIRDALATPVRVNISASVAVSASGGALKSVSAVGGLASGTRSWKGGLTTVNEEGDEIIDLPRGSRVYPASESGRMLREIGSGENNGATHVTIHMNANVREDADVNRIVDLLVRKLQRCKLNSK